MFALIGYARKERRQNKPTSDTVKNDKDLILLQEPKCEIQSVA